MSSSQTCEACTERKVTCKPNTDPTVEQIELCLVLDCEASVYLGSAIYAAEVFGNLGADGDRN